MFAMCVIAVFVWLFAATVNVLEQGDSMRIYTVYEQKARQKRTYINVSDELFFSLTFIWAYYFL